MVTNGDTLIKYLIYDRTHCGLFLLSFSGLQTLKNKPDTDVSGISHDLTGTDQNKKEWGHNDGMD